jgi:uncharacterized paraquat-inducible protein A
MSDDLDMFNIRCARADAEAEEEYWDNMEKEEQKRSDDYEAKQQHKICSFCKKKGHSVYFYGQLNCPKLKENNCKRCGNKGHTPKHCELSKSEK